MADGSQDEIQTAIGFGWVERSDTHVGSADGYRKLAERRPTDLANCVALRE